MKKIVKIDNLSFNYNNIIVFNNFFLELFNQNTSIVGTASSGKTTLAKLLSGHYLNDGVEIYDLKLNQKNINTIRKKVAVVNNDFEFIAETVADEIAFCMENLKFSRDKMKRTITEYSELFNLKEKMNCCVNQLSKSDQIIVKILSYLVINPSLIIFDDILTYLDEKQKKIIFNYLKINNITFINITTDIEEVLFSDYMIIMDKGKIIIEGNTKSVLNEEKILKRFGFNLPFAVDLSNQLKLYGIIKKSYYDINKIVGDLWK